MKNTIKHLESLFASESDTHFTPEERENHNKVIQHAIDGLKSVDVADTALHLINISQNHFELTPQCKEILKEAIPLVSIARWGRENVDQGQLKAFNQEQVDRAIEVLRLNGLSLSFTQPQIESLIKDAWIMGSAYGDPNVLSEAQEALSLFVKQKIAV